MASEKEKICHLYSLFVIFMYLRTTTAINIDCGGKPFHCVNSTHFMICVDLGAGVSTTVDNYVIQCPSTTVCRKSNSFECEYQLPTATTTIIPVGDETNEYEINSEVTTVSSFPKTTLNTLGTTTQAEVINSVQTEQSTDIFKIMDTNRISSTQEWNLTTEAFEVENLIPNSPKANHSNNSHGLLKVLKDEVLFQEYTTSLSPTQSVQDSSTFKSEQKPVSDIISTKQSLRHEVMNSSETMNNNNPANATFTDTTLLDTTTESTNKNWSSVVSEHVDYIGIVTTTPTLLTSPHFVTSISDFDKINKSIELTIEATNATNDETVIRKQLLSLDLPMNETLSESDIQTMTTNYDYLNVPSRFDKLTTRSESYVTEQTEMHIQETQKEGSLSIDDKTKSNTSVAIGENTKSANFSKDIILMKPDSIVNTNLFPTPENLFHIKKTAGNVTEETIISPYDTKSSTNSNDNTSTSLTSDFVAVTNTPGVQMTSNDDFTLTTIAFEGIAKIEVLGNAQNVNFTGNSKPTETILTVSNILSSSIELSNKTLNTTSSQNLRYSDTAINITRTSLLPHLLTAITTEAWETPSGADDSSTVATTSDKSRQITTDSYDYLDTQTKTRKSDINTPRIDILKTTQVNLTELNKRAKDTILKSETKEVNKLLKQQENYTMKSSKYIPSSVTPIYSITAFDPGRKEAIEINTESNNYVFLADIPARDSDPSVEFKLTSNNQKFTEPTNVMKLDVNYMKPSVNKTDSEIGIPKIDSFSNTVTDVIDSLKLVDEVTTLSPASSNTITQKEDVLTTEITSISYMKSNGSETNSKIGILKNDRVQNTVTEIINSSNSVDEVITLSPVLDHTITQKNDVLTTDITSIPNDLSQNDYDTTLKNDFTTLERIIAGDSFTTQKINQSINSTENRHLKETLTSTIVVNETQETPRWATSTKIDFDLSVADTVINNGSDNLFLTEPNLVSATPRIDLTTQKKLRNVPDYSFTTQESPISTDFIMRITNTTENRLISESLNSTVAIKDAKEKSRGAIPPTAAFNLFGVEMVSNYNSDKLFLTKPNQVSVTTEIDLTTQNELRENIETNIDNTTAKVKAQIPRTVNIRTVDVNTNPTRNPLTVNPPITLTSEIGMTSMDPNNDKVITEKNMHVAQSNINKEVFEGDRKGTAFGSEKPKQDFSENSMNNVVTEPYIFKAVTETVRTSEIISDGQNDEGITPSIHIDTKFNASNATTKDNSKNTKRKMNTSLDIKVVEESNVRLVTSTNPMSQTLDNIIVTGQADWTETSTRKQSANLMQSRTGVNITKFTEEPLMIKHGTELVSIELPAPSETSTSSFISQSHLRETSNYDQQQKILPPLRDTKVENSTFDVFGNVKSDEVKSVSTTIMTPALGDIIKFDLQYPSEGQNVNRIVIPREFNVLRNTTNYLNNQLSSGTKSEFFIEKEHKQETLSDSISENSTNTLYVEKNISGILFNKMEAPVSVINETTKINLFQNIGTNTSTIENPLSFESTNVLNTTKPQATIAKHNVLDIILRNEGFNSNYSSTDMKDVNVSQSSLDYSKKITENSSNTNNIPLESDSLIQLFKSLPDTQRFTPESMPLKSEILNNTFLNISNKTKVFTENTPHDYIQNSGLSLATTVSVAITKDPTSSANFTRSKDNIRIRDTAKIYNSNQNKSSMVTPKLEIKHHFNINSSSNEMPPNSSTNEYRELSTKELSPLYMPITQEIVQYSDVSAAINTQVNVSEAKSVHLARVNEKLFITPTRPTIPINIENTSLKRSTPTFTNIANRKPFAMRSYMIRTKRNNDTFTCVNRLRGRYAHENDCRKFYICISQIQHVLGECPVNTVFSEIKKQCTKNLSHCVINNQFHCIQEGRFSDALKSNIYYICVRNKNSYVRFRLQCQAGYYLNKTSVSCIHDKLFQTQISSMSSDSDSNKASDQSTVERKSIEKKKSIDTEEDICKHEGKFPDPDDCRRYYVCSKNSKSVFRRKSKKCDSDEVFHREKKKCVNDDSYECK